MLQSSKSDHIPKATITRLAIYIQVLTNLKKENVEVISSAKLARACDVNPSQIRKDLAYFGEFGVRGVGYFVSDLINFIKHALGIDRVWNCALVGVGNLGRALLRHNDFALHGFLIQGAFDCDPYKIGENIEGLEVICTRQLKDKVTSLNLEMGLITTPPERAQRATNYLVDAGISGIINFTPTRITVPDHVFVEYIDFFPHFYHIASQLHFGTHK